jgi:hypothetical protein
MSAKRICIRGAYSGKGDEGHTNLAVVLVLARVTLYIAGRRVAGESCSRGAHQSVVTHAPEPDPPPPPPPDPTTAFPGNAPTCNTSATTSLLVSRQQAAGSRQHAILPETTRGKVTAFFLDSLKHFGRPKTP